MQNNDYQKLIDEGYIPAGTLVIEVDDVTKLELSQAEVKPEGTTGPTREDKTVLVVDKQGRMKKVSSLMFGYNKKKVQLADGSFVNSVDLLQAMNDAVGRLDKGSIVVNSKGEVLDPEDLLALVKEAAGLVRIKGKSEKVTNQDSRVWAVEGAHSDVEHSKGVAFLGNNGIQLESGDYVSLDELLKALQDYMVMKPGEIIPPIPLPPKPEPEPEPKPEPKPELEPIVVRVKRKYKNKLSKWLALLAAILVLLSGFRFKDKIETIDVPVEVQHQVMEYIQTHDLDYDIDLMGKEFIYETIDEARKSIILESQMGAEIPMEEGDILHESSLLTGKQAVIGSKYRPAGNYQLSGVSVVHNGKVLGSLVDLTIKNPGADIEKFVNDLCTQKGVNVADVQIRIHLGNAADYTQTGWIDISEVFQDSEVTQDVVSEISVVKSTYEGTIEEFDGNTIIINGANGPVTLNIKDADGNLVAPGTTVIGSDGNEYIVSGLNLEEQFDEQIVTEYRTEMQQQEVVNGKKLTWRIQDCNLTLAIAPLLGAVAAAIATKKKNEEAQENPSIFEFENESEYLKFKRDFEEAKERYERTSGFKKMIKDIFYRKEVDLLQRLDEEQIKQLYQAIRTCHNGDYSYSPGDQINFRNGKVIITFADGRTQDITDIVMPSIAPIGLDNDVITEGLLEEEQRNGVRRK